MQVTVGYLWWSLSLTVGYLWWSLNLTVGYLWWSLNLTAEPTSMAHQLLIQSLSFPICYFQSCILLCLSKFLTNFAPALPHSPFLCDPVGHFWLMTARFVYGWWEWWKGGFDDISKDEPKLHSQLRCFGQGWIVHLDVNSNPCTHSLFTFVT